MHYKFLFCVVLCAFSPGLFLTGCSDKETEISPASPFSITITCNSSTINLAEGKYLVAMLSSSCDHCQETVDLLNCYSESPDLPAVAGLLLEEEEGVDSFIDQTAPRFPVKEMDPVSFFSLIGDAPPRLIYLIDGKQIRFWDDEFPATEELVDIIKSLSLS